MAADGSIIIQIDADSTGLEKAMRNLDSVVKKGLDVTAKSIAAIGVGLTTASAAAFKFGSDFESAFAGVKKTVTATEEQFKVLEAGIRDMAKSMPTAAKDIASIAEAAGQLGISTDNILTFTKTMADLGVATNLSGEQAATAFAQFANITKMSQGDFDKLGSVIVDLGNNLATTESDISNFAMRIAGAGAQIGLTVPEMMSLSGSFSSLGLSAEAGGTAVSKLMINMANAAELGSNANETIAKTGMTLRELEMLADADSTAFKELAQGMGMTSKELSKVVSQSKSLQQFSDVTGMTAEQFKKAFGEDAIGTINKFFSGLAESESKGKSTIAVLEEMGITEVRFSDAMRRASNNTGIFASSLDIANTAWEENIALTKEAEQRYDTMESKIQILQNTAADLGISVYNSMRESFSGGVDFAIGKLNELSGAFETGGFEGLVSKIGGVLSDTLTMTMNQIPQITAASGDIVIAFINGLNENAPKIGDAAAQIGVNIIETGVQLIPKVAELGVQLGTSFIGGLLDAIPELINQFGFFGKAIITATAAVLAYNIALKAMAVASAIAHTVKLLQGAVMMFGVATQAGMGIVQSFNVAMTAMNSAFVLNPIGLAVAAIGAAVGAAVLVQKQWDNAIKEGAKEAIQATKSMQEYANGIKSLNESARDSITAHAETITGLESQSRANETLIKRVILLKDEISRLTDEEEVSAAKKNELVGLVNTLNQAIPNLNLAYDEQRNILNKTNPELLTYTHNMIEIAKLEENMRRLAANEADKDAARVRQNQLGDDYRRIMKDIADEKERFNAIPVKEDHSARMQDIGIHQENLKQFNAQLKEVQSSMLDNQNTMAELNSENRRLTEAVTEGTRKNEEYAESMKKANETAKNAVRSDLEQMSNAFSKYRDEIISGLEEIEQQQKLKNAAEEEIVKLEADRLNLLQSYYDDYVSQMTEAFSEAPEQVKLSLDKMQENLEENQRATQYWSEGIKQLAEAGLDEGLIQTFEQGGSKFNTVIAQMLRDIDEQTGQITGKTKEISDTYATGVEESLKSAKEKAEDPNYMPDMVKTLDSIKGQIEEYTGIADAAQTQIDGFITAMSDMANKPEFQTMLDEFNSKGIDTSNFYVDGIIEGLKNRQVEAAQKFAEFANGLDGTVRSELDIQSPSKKAEEIGEMYIAGLAQGVDKSESKATTAVKTVAKNVNKTLRDTLTDAENAIKDKAFFGELDTEGQLTAYRELQSNYKEGSEEYAKLRKEIFTLENRLTDETYAKGKKYIDDKVHFEKISTDEQIKLWEHLAMQYKKGTDERTDADRKLFDLREKRGNEVYAKEKKDIEDFVNYSDMTTAESIAYQITEYEKLAKEYANNADKMDEINGKLHGLRKQRDQTATDDYIKNMDYELQFTEKSEKEKLVYKMSAIKTEIAARKAAGLEYAALEEKYNDYSMDLALELHNEQKRQRQEEYNADLEVFKKKTALKERDYADEIKYLATLAEEYKNDAELKKALAQEVYNYKAALTEQLANLEDQQAQRALQLFEQLMPSAMKLDLPAELKKIKENTEKNIDSAKKLGETQKEYNGNLFDSAKLTERVAELNEKVSEAAENRAAAYNRLVQAQDKGDKEAIKSAQDAYNYAIKEEETITKQLTDANKDLVSTNKDAKKDKEDMEKSVKELIKQYPQLLKDYESEEAILKLTNEQLTEQIRLYGVREQQKMKTKPQDDLLKSAKDQNKALDDYAAGMKKLENMELDSMAFEKFKKDGVSALDTINAILAMTPEQFNEYNKALSEIADKTAKMAEEEFAADIKKTKEALSGITTVITEFAESDELKESSKQIGTSMVDSEIAGIQEKQEDLTTAATTAIEDAAEAMRNIINGGVFNSIGSNIVAAVTAGFNDAIPSLLSNISAGMAATLTAAKASLQIQSPSKLFRDKIGKNIALGVGAGIKDEMPTVEATLSRHMKMLERAINQTMTLKPTAGDVLSRANNANMASMAKMETMLQAQINNVNQQQAVTPNINVVMESTGSARDVFEALSIGIKRVDYLNGGAKA